MPNHVQRLIRLWLQGAAKDSLIGSLSDELTDARSKLDRKDDECNDIMGKTKVVHNNEIRNLFDKHERQVTIIKKELEDFKRELSNKNSSIAQLSALSEDDREKLRQKEEELSETIHLTNKTHQNHIESISNQHQSKLSDIEEALKRITMNEEAQKNYIKEMEERLNNELIEKEHLQKQLKGMAEKYRKFVFY